MSGGSWRLRPVRSGWSTILIALACLVSQGCGNASPTSGTQDEPPAQAAARVFAVGERLEKEQKTKRAFAAYRQVVAQFPNSPEAKRAASRIQQAQRQAAKTSARPAPNARKGGR